MPMFNFGGQAQVPQQAQPQGGGFLQQLLAPENAMPIAAALMGQNGNAGNFSNAMQAFGQSAQQSAQRNRTLDFFRKSAPEFAGMVDAGMPMNEAWRAYTESRQVQPPKLTSDMQEYELAKNQGFNGSFMDYQISMKEAGRNQVNIDTGVKLPSGYRWIDPENQGKGVEPIPGGPANQIPGELAARIGMADSFLQQLPDIKKKVKAGETTGVFDQTLAMGGIGESGQLYRQMQSGTDALMRLLTGAGMNESEARSYAERYLPTYRDTAQSAAQKLDQLERELRSTKEMAMRGRGGDQPAGGWQDVGNGVKIRRK